MKSHGRLTYFILLGLMVFLLWLYVRNGAVTQSLLSVQFVESVTRVNEIKQNSVSWNNRTVVLHPDVKIIPSALSDDQHLVSQDCVPLPRTPRQGVVICTHPTEEDTLVSGTLKKGQLWEESYILKMQTILQADPSMIFMDVGSNIGTYAIYAAALGRRVLAVEMTPTNAQLIQKSVSLSRLGSNVVIVNNAMFSDHRKLSINFIPQNLGATRLNVSSTLLAVDKTHETVHVQTICMDDLTPLLEGATVYMKMDIENSEHHALKCAHSFFRTVNVKYVQMELEFKTEVERGPILKFMSDHGYTLSLEPDTNIPVNVDNVGRDVYFVKKF